MPSIELGGWPGFIGLILSVATLIYAFRGQMPAAADKVASAARMILEEYEQKIEDVKKESADKIADVEADMRDERKLRQDLQKETDELKLQVEQQDERLERQGDRITHLTSGVKILIRQLKDNGIKPEWMLTED